MSADRERLWANFRALTPAERQRYLNKQLRRLGYPKLWHGPGSGPRRADASARHPSLPRAAVVSGLSRLYLFPGMLSAAWIVGCLVYLLVRW